MNKLRSNRHVIFFWGLWLLLSISSVALGSQLTIDSAQQFGFAQKLMEKGDYQKAIGEFERFIHFFPNDHQALRARLLVGVCYLRDRRFEQARDVFFNLLKSCPNNRLSAQAFLLAGESYYQQGVYPEAENYFSRFIEESDQMDLKNNAAYRLGWTMMKEGRWREASRVFGGIEKESLFYASAQELEKQSLEGENLPLKCPTCAGVLAGLVPGMGHAYLTRYRDSCVAFLLNGFFIWASIESFNNDQNALGGILAFLETGWYTGNIYSAVNGAHKYNRKLRDDFLSTLNDRFNIGLFVQDKNTVGLALTFTF